MMTLPMRTVRVARKRRLTARAQMVPLGLKKSASVNFLNRGTKLEMQRFCCVMRLLLFVTSLITILGKNRNSA